MATLQELERALARAKSIKQSQKEMREIGEKRKKLERQLKREIRETKHPVFNLFKKRTSKLGKVGFKAGLKAGKVGFRAASLIAEDLEKKYKESKRKEAIANKIKRPTRKKVVKKKRVAKKKIVRKRKRKYA